MRQALASVGKRPIDVIGADDSDLELAGTGVSAVLGSEFGRTRLQSRMKDCFEALSAWERNSGGYSINRPSLRPSFGSGSGNTTNARQVQRSPQQVRFQRRRGRQAASAVNTPEIVTFDTRSRGKTVTFRLDRGIEGATTGERDRAVGDRGEGSRGTQGVIESSTLVDDWGTPVDGAVGDRDEATRGTQGVSASSRGWGDWGTLGGGAIRPAGST